MTEIKQVIVMRTDLNMPKGKMVAQGAHASMAFITRRFDYCCSHPTAVNVRLSPVEQRWLDESFVKICVKVNSEEALYKIADAAKELGIECNVVTDNGLTMFNNVPTVTCLALGPDYSTRIDPITGDLSLL